MNFNEEDLKEFQLEAFELLEASEASLLALDSGGDFQSNYDAVFRAFHSIKGGAGMMNLIPLQQHMHQLENLLTTCKEKKTIPKTHVDFFLRGIDAARNIFEGKDVKFDYTIAVTPPPQNIQANIQDIGNLSKATKPDKEAAKVLPLPTKNPKVLIEPIGRIMVVDDEPDIVDILTTLLKETGFEVLGMTDPVEALKSVEKYAPDVVLSDISMPKMDGMKLLAELHATNPELPVVILSGYVTKEVLLDSIQNGVYAVLEKPFDDKRVLQTVMNAAQRYQVSKLLNRTLNLIIYQFSDLDDFLKTSGREEIRQTLSKEVAAVLDQRKQLRALKKKVA